jgi:tetratricopeptide (TPR) repeat protein
MTARARITAISIAVLSLSLMTSVLVLRGIDKARSDATLEEALYIPSPKVLKKLSFGYDGLMADIYWTRVVQYFGDLHHRGAKRYDLLYPLLDISTTLDPHLLPAYQFGSIFLCQQPPEGAGQPEKAIELVNRGIAANPKQWQLYYNLGFIYYDMKDYAGASRAFGAGALVPGANPYLRGLAAATAQNGGSPETARLIWTELYETSTDKNIRFGAMKHLIAMRIDEEVPALAKLVRDYNEKTGHLPTNFREMVAAGWLKSIPRDPTGDPYKLLPDGRVEVSAPGTKPFVKYGLPGGPQAPDPASTQTKG